MALTTAQLVTQLYVGFYNRAPDPEGLNYWIGRVNAGVSLADIANSFAASPEAISTYPYLALPNLVSPDAFLNSIYMNLFGRAIDTGAGSGLEYYSAMLASGVRPGEVLAKIQLNANTNAGTADQAYLANKVAVGEYWVSQAVATQNFEYNAAAANSASTVLAGVTDDPATVTAANAQADAYFAAPNNGGQYELTVGVDNLVGTADNDVFNATVTATSAVLGSLDKIDGGLGIDTLNIADTATAAGANFALPAGFGIKNIENINVTTNGAIGVAGGAAFDLSGVAGVEKFVGAAAGAGTGNGSNVKVADTTSVQLTVSGANSATVAGGSSVSVTGGSGATSVTGKGLTDVVVNGGGTATIDNVDASATTAKGTTLKTVTLKAVDANSAVKGEGIESITVSGSTAASRTITVTNAKVDHALTVNVDGTGYTAAGAAAQTVVVDAAAKTITVNATGAKSNVALTGSVAATTVNITGSADLTLAALASATKLDGSAATGKLTLGDLAAGTVTVTTGAGADSFAIQATAKTTVDAGAGDDVITLKSALAAGSTINLGAGNDKLLSAGGSVATSTATAVTVIDGGDGIDSVSASLINAGNAGQFKNFDLLDISASATLDVDLVTASTITGLTLSGGTGGATVSNVAAGAGLAVSGANTGSSTINVKGAAAGAADSFAITFEGAAAAAAPVAANVTAGTVVLNGIETISINSAGAANTWNSITLTDANLKVLNISGDKNLDLAFTGINGTNSGATGGAVSLIDGSAATGKLSINTANVTADNSSVGLTVKGGSAGDTITIAQKATVDAGAGDDLITISVNGGTLTGGAGNDKFDVSAATTTSASVASAVITNITDYAKGDTIQLATASGTSTFVTTKVDISAATDLQSALNLAAATAVLANDANVTWFNYGSDTYLVQDLSASTSLAATDLVVKLTGVLDLSTAALSATELLSWA